MWRLHIAHGNSYTGDFVRFSPNKLSIANREAFKGKRKVEDESSIELTITQISMGSTRIRQSQKICTQLFV